MKRYEQIVFDVKQEIGDGYLLYGDKLPSLHEMMKRYACSKGTVLKAYDTLRNEHIIYAKAQSGYYVANDLQQYQHDENIAYDLSSGNPVVDAFSITEAKHVLNVALESYRKSSLEQEIRGVLSLTRLLADYLNDFHIYTKPRNIFLTQGVIQMLTLFTQMTFPNQKTKILVESPTFSFANKLLHSHGAPVLTIARDENGLDMDHLELLFKTEPIKFFYVVPRNHNPLGTVLPASQRRRIMELAHRYDVYIIEDDYFNDSFHIPKYEPLYYYANFDKCVYLKSYSKLFPFIRIGYAVVCDALLETFKEAIEHSYFTSYQMPSLVSQATLEAAIRSDILQNNAGTLSDRLHEKIKTLNTITQKWDPTIAWHLPAQSGYYSTIFVNELIDVDAVIVKLKQQTISVSSIEKSYYHPHEIKKGIRITITRITNVQLDHALNAIYKTLCESMTTPK